MKTHKQNFTESQKESLPKLPLNDFKALVSRITRHASLRRNWHADRDVTDVQKRIYEAVCGKYSNVFEMDGEILLVTKKGTEHFFLNKYATFKSEE